MVLSPVNRVSGSAGELNPILYTVCHVSGIAVRLLK